MTYQARFKRRATAVPNSIDRIKFDFSTAVARRLKPSRAIAVLQSSSSTWDRLFTKLRVELSLS